MTLIEATRAAVLGSIQTVVSPPEVSFLKAKTVSCLGFQFNPEFVGFRGHFEENPILPALVQTLAAKITAEIVIGKQVFIAAIIQAKFLSLVKPDFKLKVYAENPTESDDLWRFHLTATNNEGQEYDAAYLRLKLK